MCMFRVLINIQNLMTTKLGVSTFSSTGHGERRANQIIL